MARDRSLAIYALNATREAELQYQLAEINIATFRVPMSDPVNAGFIAQLDRVAECAPGVVVG